tara:strand:- start:172 stop:438 length:267 start_codon:yes stop_codon:yes gene_type:complete
MNIKKGLYILSDNKIIAGVCVALCVNLFSSFMLMSTGLTRIETELVYIRQGFNLAGDNKSELDKREGFINTTNFRLGYLERKLKEALN